MRVLREAATKVSPPPAPPRLVPRPRLLRRLTDAVDGPLTLLSAGPGAGKTVLVSTWAAGASIRTAWLTLDPSDNQPRRFWPLLASSLFSAGVASENGVLAAPADTEPDPVRFVTALLDAIEGDAPVALILDDAHLLTDATILDQLDALVRYGFPRLRLILCSRSDPLLPLHRYRLSGQMAEIRAADLAMTRNEARALLKAHGVVLSAPQLELLTARTEGWTAGLRLSAMTMSSTARPEQFVTKLALGQGSIGEYLMEEVLAGQDRDVRRLLVQTSFLDEVSGPLAAAVTGLAHSSQLFIELARTNSFVVPSDHDADRYRYHNLLREILRYLLRLEYPGLEPELRRRATTWYAEHGESAVAMRLAVAGQDWRSAAKFLVDGGFADAYVSHDDVVELGLDALVDAEDGAVRPTAVPEVVVAQAAVSVAQGDVATAQTRIADVRAGADLAPDAEATAELVEVVAAHQAGHIAMLDHAARRLTGRSVPRINVGLPAALLRTQATARMWASIFPAEAESLLLQSIDEAQTVKNIALAVESLGYLELFYVLDGRPEHAKDAAVRSLTLIHQHPELTRMTPHYLARASRAVMSMNLAGAERELQRAALTMARDADAPLRAVVTLTRAWALLAGARAADAQQVLKSAREFDRPLPEALARRRELMLADIETRLGRPNSAIRMIGEDGSRTTDPFVALMAARAHLALGDGAAARRCVRPSILADESRMPLTVRISLLIASAAAAAMLGEDAAAVATILRACDLAAGRTTQPFVEFQDSVADILARHPEAREAWPSPVDLRPVGVVIAAVERAGHRIRLAEPLTDRELTILRRLTTPMTTLEIAGELCVSPNTVKTHIAAIYRKLPASGRHEAVARARELELL